MNTKFNVSVGFHGRSDFIRFSTIQRGRFPEIKMELYIICFKPGYFFITEYIQTNLRYK